MTKSEKLTNAILASMGKEGDPIGVLVEAVLEKEFQSYDELLLSCMKYINEDMATVEQTDELIGKISEKILESKSQVE